jgi:hypothetical protein
MNQSVLEYCYASLPLKAAPEHRFVYNSTCCLAGNTARYGVQLFEPDVVDT